MTDTDLGPITVRLSEWHALQDANRAAHDRIRELEAAVLAEKEACAKLMDAIWQCLDDMGADGCSVSTCAKALLRVAFEPYRGDEPVDYPLEHAQALLRD